MVTDSPTPNTQHPTPHVRVRYAPSPTGAPHVGNIRTALFTWLYARHTGGTMVLRIEDTDRTRFVPGSYPAITESLRWLGMDWDEGPDVGGPYGPYVQSERLHLYQAAAERLVGLGDAYHCFCSEARLDQLRESQRRAGKPTGYDRRCRSLDPEAVRARLAAGEPSVVRFAMPTGGKIVVEDLVRGAITFDAAKLDDHILLKSDGFPTYHLSATLDDELMRITHVLRGEEWISSAPRHLLFHRAMGVEPPLYAQLPLIMGPDRKKLSKRNGDAAVSDYRTGGYLPNALFNFLGTLGWSLDDKTTIIDLATFIADFTLDRVGKSPAMWDKKKLDWMNGQYLRAVPDDELLAQVTDALDAELPPQVTRPVDRELIREALPLLRTRLENIGKAAEYMATLFAEVPPAYDRDMLLGKGFAGQPERAAEAVARCRARLEALFEWTADALQQAARAAAEELGIKFGDFITPVRIGVAGRPVHLPIFETMELLGRDETLRRLDAAAKLLEANQGGTPPAEPT